MTRILLGLLVCIGCHHGGGDPDAGALYRAGAGAASGASGISNPDAPADEAAIAEYARDFCGFYLRCGLPFYPDLEACIDAMSCSAQGIIDAVPISRGQVIGCSRSVVNLACESTALLMDTSCMELLVSIGSVGEALGLEPGCSEMCDASSYCDRSDDHCPRCAPRAALGESCVGVVGSSVRCANEGYCDTRTLVCEPTRSEGMACEQHAACRRNGTIGPAAWLRCLDGVCARPAEVGELCEEATDCAAFFCDGGVCREQKRGGESCTVQGECVSSYSCIHGTCVQICGFGQQSVGEPCIADFQCDEAFCDPVTSACTALRPEGGACTSSSECAADLFCDPSTDLCRERASDGAACELDDSCVSDLCNEGLCQQPICN